MDSAVGKLLKHEMELTKEVASVHTGKQLSECENGKKVVLRTQGPVTCSNMQITAATDLTHYYYLGQYLNSSREFSAQFINSLHIALAFIGFGEG